MNSRLIVTVIVKKGKNYLFGKKSPDVGPYPNTWHLLGGGVDLEKETTEEAILREVQEEAGIEIENVRRITFQEDYENDKKGEMTHYVFLIFEAEYKSGELRASDDIQELKWVKESEIIDIPLPRPSQQYFKERNVI